MRAGNNKEYLDITGQRFGRLIAIREMKREIYHKRNQMIRKYLCQCECGQCKVVRFKDLRGGTTKSCGCYGKERIRESNTRHGHARGIKKATPTYGVWNSMIQRCKNPNHKHYKSYGGRGITICQNWMDFANFLTDMGNKPEGLTLERIDNNKGYSPENCKWASMKEQTNNTRNNTMIKIGSDILTMKQVAEKYHIPYYRFQYLYRKKKIPLEEILSNESLR